MGNSDHCPFDLHLHEADYSIFGNDFYEDVNVVHEREGKIFWLNRDWFISLGVDVQRRETKKLAERWLLRNFSLRACNADETAEIRVRADRYGGFSGTAHGGSGRCIYRGRFNVKGVGCTPLVPVGLSSHTNGEYQLVEAIRGAIYSELAHYETGAGAIRTVAIIQIPPFNSPPEERRCLIVRQNFVRPAHFERSLIFGTAGFEGSDQSKDHKRVQAVRQYLSASGVGWPDVVASLARQMGSLDAMRMSQGRFTSSNMSLDGRVADFETFRIFDSWYYTKQINRDHLIFGKEVESLIKSAKRWLQLLRPAEQNDIPQFVSRFRRCGFVEMLEFLVPQMEREHTNRRQAFLDLVYDIFLLHGKRRQEDSDGWIVDPDLSNAEFYSHMMRLLNSRSFEEDDSIIISARFNAWRKTRSDISLTKINKIATEIIALSHQDFEKAQSEIDDVVHSNRRIFEYGDRNFAPILYDYREGCGRLYVADMHSRSGHKLKWNTGYGGINGSPSPTIKPSSKEEIALRIRNIDLRAGQGVGAIYNRHLADVIL